MNQRIQELADQAEDYADGIVDQGGEFHKEYTKKLAELIIQECAEFVRYKAEKAMSQEILYVGNDLLKHFGVEE